MADDPQSTVWQETLVERNVTYVLERDGKVVVVENVPARVHPETGEQFFAPETVERLHRLIRDEVAPPARFIETPVFDYAA